ncbi:MAG TPA: hypothetical protein VGO63_02105 [Candidatus Paceibacterota bacterium]|jgi:hypothetical protein|nr:hypothetical protein [Candidatus Paceibacterota bacterium]
MPIDYSKIPYIFLSEIAEDIKQDFLGAVPGHPGYSYLHAMAQLTDIDEMYGQDSASSVIAYFLANTEDWKTEKSVKIKNYLNRLLEAHKNQ